MTDRGSDANGVRGLMHRLPRWAWFDVAAFAFSLLPVVLAFTAHTRGSASDPDGIRHLYTLVHVEGPSILWFIGAPLLITVVLVPLLHLKGTRRARFPDRAAWSLATLSALIGIVGMVVEGVAMLPVAVLTVIAVAAAPRAPDPNLPDLSQGYFARHSAERLRDGSA
jgi:hypothetical protein